MFFFFQFPENLTCIKKTKYLSTSEIFILVSFTSEDIEQKVICQLADRPTCRRQLADV